MLLPLSRLHSQESVRIAPSDPESECVPAVAPPRRVTVRWVLGWAYEWFTVALYAAELTAHVLAAVDIGTQERKYVPAGVIGCSLLLGVCVWVPELFRALCRPGAVCHGMSTWKVVLGMVLLGPWLPVIGWINEVWSAAAEEVDPLPGPHSRMYDEPPPPEAGTYVGEPGVGLRLSVESAPERQWSRSLMGWVALHLRTHNLFLRVTFTMSVPLLVAHLFIVASSEPRTMLPSQALCIALSVVSIVTKAYVFSSSFDVRVFVFKFACVSYDVFAFALTVSMLRLREGALSDGLTSLTGIWLWKTLCTAAVGVLFSLIIGLIMLGHDIVDACNGGLKLPCQFLSRFSGKVRAALEWTLGILAIIRNIVVWSFAVPIFLAGADIFKCSHLAYRLWYWELDLNVTLFNVYVLDTVGYRRSAAMFVLAGATEAEKLDRTRYVHRYASAVVRQQCSNTFFHRLPARVLDALLDKVGKVEELCSKKEDMTLRQFRAGISKLRFLAFWLLYDVDAMGRLFARDVAVRLLQVGSAVSAALPFVALVLGPPLDGLQLLFFGGLTASLTAGLAVAPFTYRYYGAVSSTTLEAFGTPIANRFGPGLLNEAVARHMQLAYWARWEDILLCATPLPPDVCKYVTCFLRGCDLCVKGVTLAECQAIRRVAQDRRGGPLDTSVEYFLHYPTMMHFRQRRVI